MKRLFIALAAATAVLSSPVAAAQAGPTSPTSPYIEVPRRQEDNRKILIYFSFSCPACASHHRVLSRWARTLPKGWTYEFVPVVNNEQEYAIPFTMFQMVKATYPHRLDEFMERAYTEIQDRQMPPADMNTWGGVFRDMNLRKIVHGKDAITKQLVKKETDRLAAYRIMQTPSMVIDGRYIINPEVTKGDQSIFIQLANGMVSKAMQERR